jgi:subtilase family serine protease
MAGASADPSSTGVYLSQQFGTSTTQWLIHVAKLLGTVQPDLIATQVQAPAKISPGASGNLKLTIMNQGDGPMPTSQGGVYLSPDNVINPPIPVKNIPGDPLLATFSVPALMPNQVVTIDVAINIPSVQKSGKCYLGVALDSTNVAPESSEVNNLNPFLASDHGNAPLTIE